MENKLAMKEDTLKPFRDKIKLWIIEWWNTTKRSEKDKMVQTGNMLTHLAKALDCIELTFEGINRDLKTKEKNELIFEKLKEKFPQLHFSECPTEAEIEQCAAQQVKGKLKRKAEAPVAVKAKAPVSEGPANKRAKKGPATKRAGKGWETAESESRFSELSGEEVEEGEVRSV